MNHPEFEEEPRPKLHARLELCKLPPQAVTEALLMMCEHYCDSDYQVGLVLAELVAAQLGRNKSNQQLGVASSRNIHHQSVVADRVGKLKALGWDTSKPIGWDNK